MVVEAKNFHELNVILRNSFQALKKDLLGLKDRVDEVQTKEKGHLHTVNQLGKHLENVSNEFITTDKFNLLKIQVKELQQDIQRDLKMIERMEHAVGELADATAHQETVDNLKHDLKIKNATWKRNIENLAENMDKQIGTINRNLSIIQSSTSRKVDARIEALRKEFEDKTNQFQKQTQKETQDYRNDMQKYRKDVTAELEKQLTKSKANTLVNELNDEFNGVKRTIEKLGEEVEELSDDSRMLKKRTRTFGNIQNTFGALNENFEKLRSGVVGDIDELRDDLSELGKKAKKPVKKRELRTRAAKLAKIKKSRTRLLQCSNWMIGGAVALVVVAGILFFSVAKSQPYLVDWFVGAGAVVFLVGLICRIVHGLKS
jgi:archaellum component FlaC